MALNDTFNKNGKDAFGIPKEEIKPFQDVITGGLFDILQGAKPKDYGTHNTFRNLYNDTKGLRDDVSGKKSIIQKTDEALQRISRISDGIRAIETGSLTEELKDYGYGKFNDFYQKMITRYGKKLEKVNRFVNRVGSIGNSIINILGLKDNAIIFNARNA